MPDELYADIIIPLAVKGVFTYRVPETMAGRAVAGARAIVQFGKKRLYTGIIRKIHRNKPDYPEIKALLELVDDVPSIKEAHLKLWDWIAGYYMCSAGEVMKAAVPPGFCPESETLLTVNPGFSKSGLPDEPSRQLFNIIEKRKEVRLKSLPSVSGDCSTIKLVSNLIAKNALIAGESVKIRPGRPAEKYVILSGNCSASEIESLLDSLRKAPRQICMLQTYLKITGYSGSTDIVPVPKARLLKESGTDAEVLAALEKKGILKTLIREAAESETTHFTAEAFPPLSPAQSAVYDSLKEQMKTKNILLLQGVTSSGKTQIYINLIREYLAAGKQVLYLLPEIALTAQITGRLKKYFGPVTEVYHSRLSDNDKLDIWRRAGEREHAKRPGLILGVRSSVFLPFADPGLIIVDEEHDGSYKQHDPAPRYHARDSAIMLASFTGAHTLLGSATPSVESYYNAAGGKYGFAELKERYGRVNLPEIILVNTREAYRKRLMVSHFSPQLLEAVSEALAKREQVLLFRNRRGFSSYIECSECGWIPVCRHCAVNLTYHRDLNRMVCHYCGTSVPVPAKCPSCGSTSVETRGFGTEKTEDEIKLLFPGARVARMDQDTTRRADSFARIIRDFELHNIDILVGTQMVSKGLDFENLTVAGILNADSMLNFPDFRAHERAFQLMAQVSGRTGRRLKHGKVVIQTSDPEHKIMRYVMRNDYRAFYESQATERQTFNYPPFCRLVRLTIKHRNLKALDEFAAILGGMLREHLKNGVMGPEYPVINKIQRWYLKEILIKIDREMPLKKSKDIISEAVGKACSMPGASQLRVAIDVDPC